MFYIEEIQKQIKTYATQPSLVCTANKVSMATKQLS